MAPFDNPPSSSLNSKISPLIDGQLPDYIRDDHELFSKFIQYYYQYLEAAELIVTAQVDNVIQETFDVQYILDENGNQIVYENSVGKFSVGETITGSTSGATATILIDDQRNNRVFITSQQQFITGETLVGSTSTAEGTVIRYRANPVQNIQQLLDYADADRTIHDFLDQLSLSFMNSMPKKLATGIDKRNLIKNIRELYRIKGTSESFELFIRILLDLDAEVIYPNQFMMRPSDSSFLRTKKLRTAALKQSVGSELISQKITGQTSGATAIIADAIEIQQGSISLTEFSIDYVEGTFIAGETIEGISSTRNVSQTFLIYAVVSSADITNDGILNEIGDTLTIDPNVGNGEASAEVEQILSGGISSIVIDGAGTGHRVGDPLVFTTTQSNVSSPSAFVSVVDGALLLDGTDGSSTNAGDYMVYEDSTNKHLEFLELGLETGTFGEATALVNGSTFSNVASITLDNVVGTIVVGMQAFGSGLGIDTTVETVTSQTNITLSKKVTLSDNDRISFREAAGNSHSLRLETGNSTATDLGHPITLEEFVVSLDTYTTGSDQMVLEDGVVDTGEITRVFVENSGSGYNSLPTVTVSSTSGTKVLKSTSGTYITPTTPELIATTTDIGAASKIKITDSGANYSEAPEITFNANFVLKDTSGTFVVGEALTTHTGIVKSFNTDTQVLKTTLEDVVRTTLETTDALPIGLEDGSEEITGPVLLSYNNTIDIGEKLLDETDNDSIIINSTSLDGDAFFALEDDTGGNFLTEPSAEGNVTIPDVALDDVSSTKKIVTQIPRGLGKNGGSTVLAFTHKSTATATLNGNTFNSTVLKLDNNSGTVIAGMKIEGTSATAVMFGATINNDEIVVDGKSGNINVGDIVTGTGVGNNVVVKSIISQNETDAKVVLSSSLSLDDNLLITFLLNDLTVKTVTSQSSIIANKSIYVSDNTVLSFSISELNGPFVDNEEITGSTSGATGVIIDAGRDDNNSSFDTAVTYVQTSTQDFIVGETITGDAKFDSDENATNTTSVITSLTDKFISSPFSDWIEFKVETILEEHQILVESGTDVDFHEHTFSDNFDILALESSGFIKSIGSTTEKLLLDGTDDTVNATGRTNAGGLIVDEASGDILILEGEGVQFIESVDETRSTFDELVDVGDTIVLDGDLIDVGNILLEGTDTAGTDSGSTLLDESSSRFPQGVLILDGTDSNGTDAGGILLGEIEPEDGVIALDGTDSSSSNADSSVVHEVDGIDFSAGTTTITTSGGFTGTIVAADISKGSSNIDIITLDESVTGDIKGLLGESLNRLQDSLFYQQYSYEINTGAGVNEFINELKKAVHPAGFAVFGKVKIAQQVDNAMVLDSKPMTISNFVGDRPIQVKRSLAAFDMQPGSLFDVVVQEDSLSTGINEFMVLDGTDTGSSNAGDDILQESATAGTTSNNLILDATDFNESDIRGDFLLDGTDADGTDAGDSLELEDELHEPKNKFIFERIDNPNGVNHNALIKEDGSFLVPETSPVSGSGPLRVGETTDVSVVKSVSLKLSTNPAAGPSRTSLGLVGLATPFGGADALETELGTIRSKSAQEAHHKRNIGIIPTFFPVDIRQDGNLLSEDDGGGPSLSELSTFPLSDFVRTGIIDIGTDAYNTTSSSETVGILLEETEAGFFKQEDESTVAATHGDDILLENATGPNLNEKLLLESLRIELEDNTDTAGVVPFQNFETNTLDSIAISSDILSEEGLSVALEENSGPDHILLNGTNENGENAGFFLIDESESGFQILFESVETEHSDNSGIIIFDGAEDIVGDDTIVIEDGGTDGSGTNADDNILLDSTAFTSEEQLITEDGNDIVLNNFALNQDEGGIDPTGAGDKLVTDGDATDHEGNILTDGDFKVQSIGDKALFELQTRSDLLNNSAYSVPGVPSMDSVLITIDSSLDMSVV
jgi:hypothetical protein